jgi:hypothetical protein
MYWKTYVTSRDVEVTACDSKELQGEDNLA